MFGSGSEVKKSRIHIVLAMGQRVDSQILLQKTSAATLIPGILIVLTK